MPMPSTLLWTDSPDADRAELVASRDTRTGEIVFPAVPDNSPLADAHELVAIGRTGTVYSATVIHPSPRSGLPPYVLGYVDMDDQPVRIFGRVNGDGAATIGTRCRALADDTFGYVFQTTGDTRNNTAGNIQDNTQGNTGAQQ